MKKLISKMTTVAAVVATSALMVGCGGGEGEGEGGEGGEDPPENPPAGEETNAAPNGE